MRVKGGAMCDPLAILPVAGWAVRAWIFDSGPAFGFWFSSELQRLQRCAPAQLDSRLEAKGRGRKQAQTARRREVPVPEVGFVMPMAEGPLI